MALVVTMASTALAASVVRYNPCTHIDANGYNSSGGGTVWAYTAEYLDNCDAVRMSQLKYVDQSYVTRLVYYSSSDPVSHYRSKPGIDVIWSQHRAADPNWVIDPTLYG